MLTKKTTVISLLAIICLGVVALCICLFPTQNKQNNVYADEGDVYTWSYIPGDVNQDGKVTSQDVDALKELISNGSLDLFSMHPSNKTSGMLAGDVNTDDRLNSIDVAILSDYLAGKIKLIPITEAEWLGLIIPSEYKTKFGDVNRDGRIDKNDLTKLKAAVNNEITLDDYAHNNADVNKDRAIDNKDVEILDYFLQGKVTQLPCRYVKFESWWFVHHEEIGYDTFHTEKWTVNFSLGNPINSVADGLGQIGNALGDVGNGIKKGCEDIYNGIRDFFGGFFK
ncbi:MAG: dockerin type I repeat-containing protein [Clostridia bacterium]|nr:dockerin type I repeat-containing protein [Clostridia bacterium]